jgi:hypothetical protein
VARIRGTDRFEEDAASGDACSELDDIYDALALFRDKPQPCGDEAGCDVGEDVKGPGQHR